MGRQFMVRQVQVIISIFIWAYLYITGLTARHESMHCSLLNANSNLLLRLLQPSLAQVFELTIEFWNRYIRS